MIASRYVPVRLIAKGGMGAIYEVEHARTGERLALKVLLSLVGSSAEELERFKREARAPAQIKSEHVVHVTDADIAPELEGAPFLVMELLEGVDLEREAAATPPSPATGVEWLRQSGAVAVDATSIYWMTQGTSFGEGTVMKAPLAGASSVTLASGLTGVYSMAVNRGHTLFEGAMMSVPLRGGAPTTIAAISGSGYLELTGYARPLVRQSLSRRGHEDAD